jgi:hypothetical protein
MLASMSTYRKLLLPAALLALLTACSSSPSKPAPFTLSGAVTLASGATDASDGVSCTGWAGAGFGQVVEGAPVVVVDRDGVRVGAGSLGLGKAPAGYAVPCRFLFRVAGVPAGAGPYQVRVADQKAVAVSEATARGGRFAVSLG